ncbi:MAG: ABC-2 family transporter protein, partial [Treponema sp.]|nr:ABC-2 family transporter protein [Treponema sp.]
LTLLFFKTQLMADLEYRINFFAGMLVETGYFFAKLAYVFVVIETDLHLGDLGDFGPYHIITCIGVYVVLTGLYMFFYPALLNFPGLVQSGMLDLLIIKPAPTFFLVSVSKSSLAMLIPDFVLGWALVIWGWAGSGEPFIAANLLLGLAFMLLGTALTFALFSLPIVISLWVVRVEKLHGVLGSLWDFNNMPMNNYPRWMRWLGLFVLPIFAITNPAAFAFLNRTDMNLAAAAVAAPLVLGAVVSRVWKQGIRQYHSAGA